MGGKRDFVRLVARSCARKKKKREKKELSDNAALNWLTESSGGRREKRNERLSTNIREKRKGEKGRGTEIAALPQRTG